MTEQIHLMVAQVLEGSEPALKSYIELKKLEKTVTEAIKQVQDLALDEADKYGQKSFSAFGAKVELKSGASRWDFSNVHHVLSAKETLKKFEELAKIAATSSDPIYDSDGLQVEPATKIEGKSTLAVTLINGVS